jgi:hypothetical protein
MFAQNEQKGKFASNSFFFAPLNVFDFINPSLQIGYERIINKKYAIQVEGGYILNHSVENYLIDLAKGIQDCPYSNSGFKIRTEFKYFFKIKKKVAFYTSGELFYTKNKSWVADNFIVSDPSFEYPVPKPENANVYTDFFCNDKQRFGINAKIGIKLWMGKHFFMEPHIGIGLVYRISRQFERDNLNDKLYDEVLSFNNKEGKAFILNLPLNIKMGFSF